MQGGTAPAMHVHIQTSGLLRAAEGKAAPHFFQDHLPCGKGIWSRSCEPLGLRKMHPTAQSAVHRQVSKRLL